MASSPSNSQSEPAKVEQIITEFFTKILHIILESRSPCASSRNYSGEQTVSSPSSSSSSSSVRPRDKWFNLALRECPASLDNLDFWRHSNLEPLIIDVILVQRSRNPDAIPASKGSPLRNPSLKDQLLGRWNSGQREFISETKYEKIIERWVVQYESRKNSGSLRDLSSGRKKRGGCASFHSSETPAQYYKKTYRRSIILLRSLYVTVRLLPAYKLFRDLNSSGQIHPFSLTYKVSSFVEPFTRREEAEMQQFNFVPVDTTCGRLCLSLSYCPTLLDVSSEPSTPISTQFISDYVGSPTTDPLRRLPSLPLTQSPASPSPIAFVRRHSWSNDLHRAVPSFSPSPSPTYSDSRAFASKPNSHHLPPRGHVNMDISSSVSSPHHFLPDTPRLSNASPPFSPSPSPSPPTHLPGTHSSKAIFRSESAPVSIPSAMFGWSRGLSNPVLPPSSSPKGMRPGSSSDTDSLRAQASQGSGCHSSSPDSRYKAKQDPVGSGQFQTSSAAHKMLSFPKDEVANFFGAKIPFSRSSSRLSFQDEFDDSGFTYPFLVDDDDRADPYNRSECFEGKGNTSEGLESMVLLSIKRSPDAAIGSFVRLLQTAGPLHQDSSDSVTKKYQPNQNLESGKGTPQTAESDTGIVASGLHMSKTTAAALEDLRSFKEMKDLLIQQGGYHQSLDAVQTAKTLDQGTSEF